MVGIFPRVVNVCLGAGLSEAFKRAQTFGAGLHREAGRLRTRTRWPPIPPALMDDLPALHVVFFPALGLRLETLGWTACARLEGGSAYSNTHTAWFPSTPGISSPCWM